MFVVSPTFPSKKHTEKHINNDTALILGILLHFSDNAAIHHCRQVIDAINATGALMMYLPTYSPDFNPCEGVFSQAKSWIRENEVYWQLCDEPEEMVFEAFMDISDENVKNYIRDTEYL